MNKLINSISFYCILFGGIVLTLNNEFGIFNIIGILILAFIYISMKDYTKEEVYEVLGITWLQKKFKNNPVIMDMTNE